MLLVILDPFGGLPIFITLTSSYSDQRARRSAHRAARVAFFILLPFIFLGQPVLDFFGVSLFSFQVGGGLVLLLLGLMYVLDISPGGERQYAKDIIIPMATPLIAGPGAITAVILLVQRYGYWLPLFALTANLLLFWGAMYFARPLSRWIGRQGLEILSRIMGLMLVAIAVEMIKTAMLHEGIFAP